MGSCTSNKSVSVSSNGTKTNEDQNGLDSVLHPSEKQQDALAIGNLMSSQKQSITPTNSYLERAKQEFEIKYTTATTKTAKLADFQLQRTIGMGSFGRVMLAKHGNQLLALKIMSKQSIIESNQVEHVLSEKKFLQAIKHPFIVNLIYAFKDNACLYLALEFASGGELFSNLR